MSGRNLSTTQVTAVSAEHVERVVMVSIDFDDPVYVHSGIGIISFDGNEYIGIGALGRVSDTKESEILGPMTLEFTLSGLDMNLLKQAMDSTKYGAEITMYSAIKDEAGDLVGDPFIVWAGKVDSTQYVLSPNPSVTLIGQHDIDQLNEADGGRWSDEDHQNRYSGDLFFEHIADVPTLKLLWGGGPTSTGSRERRRGIRPPPRGRGIREQ